MHLTTTPDDCLICNLCADVCPIDAMDKPVEEKESALGGRQMRVIALLVLLVPLLSAGGGLLGGLAAPVLSRLNPDVRLSEQVLYEDAIGKPALTLESKAFRGTGKPLARLLDETGKIRDAYFLGSVILGAFMGLVLGIRLIRYSYVKTSEIYSPNKARCVSCGRCIEACPKEKNRIKIIQQKRNTNENPAGK
jgi:Fe-S oxidoreductase